MHSCGKISTQHMKWYEVNETLPIRYKAHSVFDSLKKLLELTEHVLIICP